MNKVIAIKAWKRPDYFETMLSALEQCINIEEYILHISIDGGVKKQSQNIAQQAMQQRIEQSPLYKNKQIKTLVLQPKNIGCAGNTRLILDKAFNDPDTDFVIHLEDDTVPAKDLLLYMEWANKTFKSDPKVFSISGYNRTPERHNISENLGKTYLCSWFSCWGFGLFRRIYEEISASKLGIFGSLGGGSGFGTDTYNEAWLKNNTISDQGSWARPFNHYYRRDRVEVHPYVGRIQNIGEMRGKWNPGGEWWKKNQYCPEWYENTPNKTAVYEFHMPDKTLGKPEK